MNPFRKRTPKEVAAIKNKSNVKVNPKEEEIKRKLLQASMEEGEVIQGFISGKITAEQLPDRLAPIETKRIETVLEANKKGFKVEKTE